VAGTTGTALAKATGVIHPRAGQHRQPGSAVAGPATAYVLSVSALTGGSGKVTQVLTATNKTLRPIVAKGVPAAIAITPDGKTAYVIDNKGSNTPGAVIPIRIATNTALPPIQVGVDPDYMEITPDGKTVYVSNSKSGTVTPIRTATNTALPRIKVGREPYTSAPSIC
jgi:YVTN family beta-propeller protein